MQVLIARWRTQRQYLFVESLGQPALADIYVDLRTRKPIVFHRDQPDERSISRTEAAKLLLWWRAQVQMGGAL